MTWMAPELEHRKADQRSDVYSLGCIILAMVMCYHVDIDKLRGYLVEMKLNPLILPSLLNTARDVWLTFFSAA